MNDVPIKFESKFHIKTELLDDTTIIQTTTDSMMKAMSRYIMDTTNQQVYEKLMELGWTPPPNLGIKVQHKVKYPHEVI